MYSPHSTWCSIRFCLINQASILYKSIAGRYRPVSYPDGPITARYIFIKNAYWELLDRNICPTYKLIIKDLYNGLTTKVKWLGSFSDSFDLRQGVRQGGVLSTYLYKIFVEDQLLELETNALGFMLGNIYIGATAVADGLAYLSSTQEILQLMQNVGYRYSDHHHYKIHPTKTKIVEHSSEKGSLEYSWKLGDNVIKASEETIHLGLKRTVSHECEINIEDRIKLARRTKYAFMNSGYHGTNGLSPATSYRFIKPMISQDLSMDLKFYL